MNIEIQSLRKRWRTPAGEEMRRLVLNPKAKKENFLAALDTFHGNGKGFIEYVVYAGKGTAADLRGMDFSERNLSGIAFGDEFSCADFSGCTLNGALFNEGIFYEACFDGAQGEDIQFYQTYAQGASFRGARFKGALFIVADLRHADFSDAILEDCDFSGALLEGAIFQGTSMIRCKMPVVTES